MNKNKLALLASISLLSLSGCNSSATGAVGIFIYDKDDTFMSSLASSIQYKLTDASISYDPVFYANRNQTTQNQDFISFLDESSSKAMVVNTVDRLASSALMEKAETKNKPIVFINREPLKEDLTRDDWSTKNCYYVGADSAYEGILQAKIADEFFGGTSSFIASSYDKNGDGKLQTLVFKGEIGHQDAEARTKNSLLSLTERGYNIDLVDTVYCNWERDTAYEKMSGFDTSGIELLLCNNDDMALGAIDYLVEKDKTASSEELAKPFSTRYFPIIGVDATNAGKEALKNSYLTGTVLNDAGKQSSVIIDVLNHLISSKDIPAYGEELSISGNMYYVRGSIVTKNSL